MTPFEDDYDNVEHKPKTGLKNVSSQKSMFDAAPNKATQQDFDNKVKKIQESKGSYERKAADLVIKYKSIMRDKTLKQNKNVFMVEMEKEVIFDMVQLAIEKNNDPDEEKDGMGSMAWITLLLQQVIAQKDRINELEYQISQFNKRLNAEPPTSTDIQQK
jgi:hypothetical protein